MSHRDVFSKFEILEEHKIGPITVFKMINPEKNDPDLGKRYLTRYVYGVVSDFGTVRKDPELQFEMHNLTLRDGTVVNIEEDDLSVVSEENNDLLCHLAIPCTEKAADETIRIAHEDFSRYAV